MQEKILLNEKLRYRPIPKPVLISANRHDDQNHTATSDISLRVVETNQKDIKETIILLEHVITALEKKVTDLKVHTNTLKAVSQSNSLSSRP